MYMHVYLDLSSQDLCVDCIINYIIDLVKCSVYATASDDKKPLYSYNVFLSLSEDFASKK